MKIDLDWLAGKSACGGGKDWFAAKFPKGAEYVEVLAGLASDGKHDYLTWLMNRARVAVDFTPLVDAAIKFTMSKVNFKAADKMNSGTRGSAANSGTRGSAANSGTRGSAANSGYAGSAANSGEAGSAANSGEEGVAASFAPMGKVQGSKGSWIVCDEWKFSDKENRWRRISVQAVKVDGKKIKADTWYQIKGGKFVAVE